MTLSVKSRTPKPEFDEGFVNAAGRWVPATVNRRPYLPYAGVGKHLPQGKRGGPQIRSCAEYPGDGNKVAPSLRAALERAGLRDGMVLSTHHHFRNGDLVAALVFKCAEDLGI